MRENGEEKNNKRASAAAEPMFRRGAFASEQFIWSIVTQQLQLLGGGICRSTIHLGCPLRGFGSCLLNNEPLTTPAAQQGLWH